MSRSYKKPYVKIGWPGMKKVGARMERRIVKQLLKPWKSNYCMTAESSCFGCECYEWGYACEFSQLPIEPLLPLRKQIADSYDICDTKIHRPNQPKYYRK